jgi:two-component system chemotaxis response regulator CheB
LASDRLRILVVEDSALYRQLIRNVLRVLPDVEVVGTAATGEEALAQVAALAPNLLTLDVRMPGMDGIAVLRELKKKRSRSRAIMLSSLTGDGAQVTTDALLEGAFDFILKPAGPDANANRQYLQAALADKIQAFRQSRAAPVSPRHPAAPAAAKVSKAVPSGATGLDAADPPPGRCEVVVVGTSTGGPVALRQVLPSFPDDFPVPILIVQHMPPQYTHSLAERLNEASALEVVEGCEGMTLEPGWAYLAPGGRHMKVATRAGRQVLRITDDQPENGVRPSVDYLLRSAAKTFGGKVVAVILTGMGKDGLEGCRQLKRQGGFILAQHPDGCVVYGMPKAVVEEGLADQVQPLERIASSVMCRVCRP